MKTIKGNLIELAKLGKFDFIVHGANCFNTMKSGIAKQIAENFSDAVYADQATVKGDRSKLGKYTQAAVRVADNKKLIIVNAYTQYTYSRSGDVFEYGAFFDFLRDFSSQLRSDWASQTRSLPFEVGFPLIGCGLAGGNKDTILMMIDNFSAGVSAGGDIANVTVVEFSPEFSPEASL